MLAIDSPYDVAGRDSSSVRDVQHLDALVVQPRLADVELGQEAFASPVISVGDVLDFAVNRHRVDGQPTVFVSDVHDNLVHESTRLNCIVSLGERKDWSPLIPSSKLIRV